MRVTLDGRAVGLAEPEDFGAFCVASAASTEEIASVLAATSVGWVEGDDVFVRIEALRGLAGADRSPEWHERLDAMVAYARTKNWTDATGTAVRAHVERPSD